MAEALRWSGSVLGCVTAVNETVQRLSTSAHVRVLIVDSRPLVREGLAAVLQREPDLYACGAAEDRYGALEAIPLRQPDLTTVAIKLGEPDGLELIKDLRADTLSERAGRVSCRHSSEFFCAGTEAQNG